MATEETIRTQYTSSQGEGKTFRSSGSDHRFATALECRTSTESSTSTCAGLRLVGHRFECGDRHYLIEDEWRDGSCEWLEESRTTTTTMLGSTLECPENKAMTGIDCFGRDCIHLRIQCCAFGHVCRKLSFSNERAGV